MNTIDEKAHVKKRISKTFSALNKVRLAGLIEKELKPETRAYLFNTYVRPIVHYGLENYEMDYEDIKKVETAESTVLKSFMSINKQCHHTSLMRSVGIKSFVDNVIINKMKFYKRLIENNWTRSIVEELLSLKVKNSLPSKINHFLGDDSMMNWDIIRASIQHKINKISTDINNNRKNDPKVNELKKCFKIKNHCDYIIEIRKIIGY